MMASEDNQEVHGDPFGRSGFDRKLLELLVCPLTKSRLEYDAGAQELISRAAGLAFPIRDGIPFLTREDARELGDAEAPPRGPTTDR